MPKPKNIFVSVILLLDNRSIKSLAKIKKIVHILKENYSNYELIIVDNGIPADYKLKLEDLLESVPCVRIISLAKTVDIDNAFFAGIEVSIGDYICTLYNQDPVRKIPEFIEKAIDIDVVQGQVENLRRGFLQQLWTKAFYVYSRKFLNLDLNEKSTYYVCFSRTVANAIMRGERRVKHLRHILSQVGFSTEELTYSLEGNKPYTSIPNKQLIERAIDLTSNYSNSPLRFLSFIGIVASFLNLVYAGYVVIVNLTQDEIERGWTTLSAQSSFMFFILFLLLAVLAEYIGKIIVESRNEPTYHITKEKSSTISFADEERVNVEK